MLYKKPIVAISTPLNKSAIGIIRISFGNLNNKDIYNIIKKLFNKTLYNRKASYVSFIGIKNLILDNGIALFFKKPNSYTGENLLEFHGHGNPYNLKNIVKNILIILRKYKIRLAKPGEFTKRAFENKKLNLIQIENFFNIINFNKSINKKKLYFYLNFNLSYKLKKILLLLEELIFELNYYINFDNNFYNIKLNYRLKYIKNKFLDIIKSFGNLNKKKLSYLVIGFPNTGKSTLINKIKNKNYILTSNYLGTTRDLIKIKLNFINYNVNLFDSVGLYYTKNKIENLGIKKTLKKIKKIHYIFYIFFNNNFLFNKHYIKIFKKFYKIKNIIRINNKIDLYNKNFFLEFILKKNIFFIIINISSLNKNGIFILINFIKKLSDNTDIKSFFLNFKHNYIKILKSSFNRFKNIFYYYNTKKFDILNEELIFLKNMILNLLNKKFFNYFNKIFKNFCIGK